LARQRLLKLTGKTKAPRREPVGLLKRLYKFSETALFNTTKSGFIA
jgi:hypothetical protein